MAEGTPAVGARMSPPIHPQTPVVRFVGFTALVMLSVPLPEIPDEVAVMDALPASSAAAKPAPVIVATTGLLLAQVTVAVQSMLLPSE